MANRSDFYKAKLPRQIKRMLSLMSTGDSAHDSEVKKLFIEAHDRHVKYKMKRNSGEGDSLEDGTDNTTTVE